MKPLTMSDVVVPYDDIINSVKYVETGVVRELALSYLDRFRQEHPSISSARFLPYPFQISFASMCHEGVLRTMDVEHRDSISKWLDEHRDEITEYTRLPCVRANAYAKAYTFSAYLLCRLNSVLKTVISPETVNDDFVMYISSTRVGAVIVKPSESRSHLMTISEDRFNKVTHRVEKMRCTYLTVPKSRIFTAYNIPSTGTNLATNVAEMYNIDLDEREIFLMSAESIENTTFTRAQSRMIRMQLDARSKVIYTSPWREY